MLKESGSTSAEATVLHALQDIVRRQTQRSTAFSATLILRTTPCPSQSTSPAVQLCLHLAHHHAIHACMRLISLCSCRLVCSHADMMQVHANLASTTARDLDQHVPVASTDEPAKASAQARTGIPDVPHSNAAGHEAPRDSHGCGDALKLLGLAPGAHVSCIRYALARGFGFGTWRLGRMLPCAIALVGMMIGLGYSMSMVCITALALWTRGQ